MRKQLVQKLTEPVDAASLAFFRIVFGLIMLFSQVRFLLKGWVYQFYIKPSFSFKFYGFHWVATLAGNWMYLPWIAMILCLILIILGKYYRFAIIAFFLLFSYTELLDLTYYLNHYYLITLLSFLMIFLPMNACFSLDSINREMSAQVPRFTLTILRLQVGMVYFFAGLSKIKYDWLIHAEPLKVWLNACQNIPIAGPVLAMPITAYLFSWAGMLFDLTAPFLLLNKHTRPYEYAVIVLFHVITLCLFYIGMFPAVMIGVALIFFSPVFHRRALQQILPWLNRVESQHVSKPFPLQENRNLIFFFFGLYFLWQLIMPLRYLFYKGDVLWTEQGFRYAWNVMLIEKDGYVEFYVEDRTTGKRYIEYPKKYLNALQEKMMSTQPDMIFQYANFLANKYRQKLQHPVSVYADTYVSLNQRQGQMLIDPKFDLTTGQDNLCPKNWILPEK